MRERADRLSADARLGVAQRALQVRQHRGRLRRPEDADDVAHEVPAGVDDLLAELRDVGRRDAADRVDEALARRHVGLVGELLEQRLEGQRPEHVDEPHRGGVLGRVRRIEPQRLRDALQVLRARESRDRSHQPPALLVGELGVLGRRAERRRDLGCGLDLAALDEQADRVSRAASSSSRSCARCLSSVTSVTSAPITSPSVSRDAPRP